MSVKYVGIEAGMRCVRKEIKKKVPAVRTHRLKASPSKSQIRRDTQKVQKLTENAKVVIFGVLDGAYASLINRINDIQNGPSVGVVSFGSPYLLRHFSSVDGYLCAYGFRWASEIAAARAVIGENPPTGQLPVSLPGGPQFGHGMDYAAAGEPIK